jgi:hypothetical protein
LGTIIATTTATTWRGIFFAPQIPPSPSSSPSAVCATLALTDSDISTHTPTGVIDANLNCPLQTPTISPTRTPPPQGLTVDANSIMMVPISLSLLAPYRLENNSLQVRIGSGAVTLNDFSAVAVFVDELNADGSIRQVIPLPSVATAAVVS